MTTPIFNNEESRLETPFLGLAPFLRKSIAGVDIMAIAREHLAAAETAPDDANLWMNLSIAMQCVGQHDLGLSAQVLALELQRIFYLAAAEQPAKLRLLMLMVPGDLAENTPLDCLLEKSDVDLVFCYLSHDAPLPSAFPEHDAVIVGISDSSKNRGVLSSLEKMLTGWPAPVINAPQYIPVTERGALSEALQNVPGLLIPPAHRVSRQTLLEISAHQAFLPALFYGCDFPIILRPVGSQGGRDLQKMECPEDVAAYLSSVNANDVEFFVARFIDYRGQDGLFRKARVALIGGEAFACHMAVSSNWMIHYVNANMYEDAWRRNEEANFMANFDDFIGRHQDALTAVYQRTKLDYLCIDCAETQDGELLVFEADHVMVVHAMDTEDLFPYKQPYMHRVRNAFRDLVFRLISAHRLENLACDET